VSALPSDYWTALELLAKASSRFHSETGNFVVIVGGAAVSFYTHGAVLSGDFDMVADLGFEPYLLAEGFRKEERQGRLLKGYYHPSVPLLGFEFVSGALFDGKADWDKLLAVPQTDGAEVVFPAIEDLIADRLGQYASSNNKDKTMLSQASLLFELAFECDVAYLKRRIIEETGDPSQIGLM
jgi:hypothetical protein